MMIGYSTCIASCKGQEPAEALQQLAEFVMDAANKHNMVAQGGIWIGAYADTHGTITWVVAQAMVQLSMDMDYFKGEEMR
jgi:hypothetical protein